jgi:undecaprenyl-diphosphatase
MRAMLRRIQHGDCTLLMIFNNSLKCKPLDLFMPAVTYLGSLTFSVLFCLTTLLNPNNSVRVLGFMTAVSLMASSFIVQIIKVSVSRIRPFLKIDNLNIKLIGIDQYSFPSGHTTAAFTMAIMTSLCFPSFTMIAIFLALCVGISRMYTGVHYPTDVFIGMFIGTLTSFAIYLIA